MDIIKHSVIKPLEVFKKTKIKSTELYDVVLEENYNKYVAVINEVVNAIGHHYYEELFVKIKEFHQLQKRQYWHCYSQFNITAY